MHACFNSRYCMHVFNKLCNSESDTSMSKAIMHVKQIVHSVLHKLVVGLPSSVKAVSIFCT